MDAVTEASIDWEIPILSFSGSCEQNNGKVAVNVTVKFASESAAKRAYTEVKGLSVSVDGRNYEAQETAIGFTPSNPDKKEDNSSTVIVIVVVILIIFILAGLYVVSPGLGTPVSKSGLPVAGALELNSMLKVTNITIRVEGSSILDHNLSDVLLKKPSNVRHQLQSVLD